MFMFPQTFLKMKDLKEFELFFGNNSSVAPAAGEGVGVGVTTVGAEGAQGVQDILKLQQLLCEGYGLSSDWLQFDASVVRGLSYYTGIVFEGFDREGKLRAICGGGRYDKLVHSMSQGADSVPAVGFGFGDAVIVELLKSKQLIPAGLESAPIVDVVVYALDPALRLESMQLAAKMRAARPTPFRVDLVLEDNKKLKTVLQRAEKSNASVLVLLAPDEHSKGEVVVKDLRKRAQSNLPYCAVMDKLNELLQVQPDDD